MNTNRAREILHAIGQAQKTQKAERGASERNDSCSPAVGAFIDSLSDEQTMARVVEECSSEAVREVEECSSEVVLWLEGDKK